jgi:hypothetical protein
VRELDRFRPGVPQGNAPEPFYGRRPSVCQHFHVHLSNLFLRDYASLAVRVDIARDRRSYRAGLPPCGNCQEEPAAVGYWRAGCARDRWRPAVVCAETGNTTGNSAGILRERRDSNPRPPA